MCKDAVANAIANHADKFKKMQAEALTLGLAFCEFHGWTTYGQPMTPRGVLNHSKTSTAWTGPKEGIVHGVENASTCMQNSLQCHPKLQQTPQSMQLGITLNAVEAVHLRPRELPWRLPGLNQNMHNLRMICAQKIQRRRVLTNQASYCQSKFHLTPEHQNGRCGQMKFNTGASAGRASPSLSLDAFLVIFISR